MVLEIDSVLEVLENRDDVIPSLEMCTGALSAFGEARVLGARYSLSRSLPRSLPENLQI